MGIDEGSKSSVPDRAALLWKIGTVGYTYPEWNGTFYPKGLAAGERLTYVASRFDAVEINATFHAIPAEAVVRRWATRTPDSFSFTLKMPREVTHGPAPVDGTRPGLAPLPPGHLMRPGTREVVDRFTAAAAVLGSKLGAVLVQFPRVFGPESRSELGDFVNALPRSMRYAVELRHPGWRTADTGAMLRAAGVCWAMTDETPGDQAALAPTDEASAPIVQTTDFLYIRWLGRHGQFSDRSHEHIDPSARLAWWARQVQRVLKTNPTIGPVFGFFDNAFAGHSPATARRMMAMLGVEKAEPAPAGAAEPTLFDYMD